MAYRSRRTIVSVGGPPARPLVLRHRRSIGLSRTPPSPSVYIIHRPPPPGVNARLTCGYYRQRCSRFTPRRCPRKRHPPFRNALTIGTIQLFREVCDASVRHGKGSRRPAGRTGLLPVAGDHCCRPAISGRVQRNLIYTGVMINIYQLQTKKKPFPGRDRNHRQITIFIEN